MGLALATITFSLTKKEEAKIRKDILEAENWCLKAGLKLSTDEVDEEADGQTDKKKCAAAISETEKY